LRTGRPIKCRRGEYFRAWTAALEGAGFKVEWRILNAADFGDATTRERFFLMARSDGKRMHWPDPTHSRAGGADLLGHGRHKWRAAREIIDWSIEGKSIFDCKRPLSRKTLARIYAGAVKFRWPAPFLVILRNHMDAHSVDEPLPTVCPTGQARGLKAHGGTHIGLAEPFLLNRHGENGSVRCHDLGDPIPTVTCRGAGFVVEPFILSQHAGGAPRAVAEPMPGMTCGGAHALIAPYYTHGSGQSCSGTDQPLPTVTTKARFGLVIPVTHGADPGRYRSPRALRPGGVSIVIGAHRIGLDPTGSSRGEFACIIAAFGERKGQAPRVHSVDEPAPTICAQGRVQLVEPIIEGRQYDIRFRMLEPKELARAMGFSDAETAYEFAGNKTEITKQIGNTVPVNLAAALVGALMQS
jgi:DNA (cytosine-5)-methyltransferase 1